MNIKSHLATLLFLISGIFAEGITHTYTFPSDNHGWQGDFADYPIGDELFYELAWGWEDLPSPYLGESGELTKGLYLAGNNHSDDLFMFFKYPLTSLEKEKLYSVKFSLIIESNVPEGLLGVGGSPGEGVTFKVGATDIEPRKKEVDGYFRMNIDKGNQAVGGENAIVIGNMANSDVDPDHRTYKPKVLQQELPFHAKSDSEGRLWLIVGSDSGFESFTKYYIVQVKVQLTPL